MAPLTESHAAKCFHVELAGNCQFSWKMERGCHREDVIIWLTVNVIRFYLFSCLKSRLRIVLYTLNDTENQFFVAPTHHMCLQCCVCLNGVASSRAQGMRCSISSLYVNWPYLRMPFLFFFTKKWEWTLWGWREHPRIFLFWTFISLFFFICLFSLNQHAEK